jgi:hypothetical protein
MDASNPYLHRWGLWLVGSNLVIAKELLLELLRVVCLLELLEAALLLG